MPSATPVPSRLNRTLRRVPERPGRESGLPVTALNLSRELRLLCAGHLVEPSELHLEGLRLCLEFQRVTLCLASEVDVLTEPAHLQQNARGKLMGLRYANESLGNVARLLRNLTALEAVIEVDPGIAEI